MNKVTGIIRMQAEKTLSVPQIIKGQRVFFRDNGQQVKGAYLDIYNDL